MPIFAFLMAASALTSAPVTEPADFTHARTIDISLSSFDVTPAVIHLEANRPVILHITNRSRQGHDFTASDFFTAARLRPYDARSVREGTIDLRGGQDVNVGLKPASGRYTFKCGRPLHKMLGRSGTIIVTP
jgi:hypothetical protein